MSKLRIVSRTSVCGVNYLHMIDDVSGYQYTERESKHHLKIHIEMLVDKYKITEFEISKLKDLINNDYYSRNAEDNID
jgi:hypothetical protein